MDLQRGLIKDTNEHSLPGLEFSEEEQEKISSIAVECYHGGPPPNSTSPKINLDPLIAYGQTIDCELLSSEAGKRLYKKYHGKEPPRPDITDYDKTYFFHYWSGVEASFKECRGVVDPEEPFDVGLAIFGVVVVLVILYMAASLYTDG